MHRYFEDPALLARDRPLFQKTLPVFDALNKAGWQPVTHVRSSVPTVRVERYGEAPAVMLTVGNTTAEAQTAMLTLDRDWWEKGLGREGAVAFRSPLTEETIRAEPKGSALACPVTIPAHRTLVLRVQNN